jgi:hypothetical protein
MSADSRIARAAYALRNAEQGGNLAIISSCQSSHREAIDRQLPWTTSTIQALEAVRLYAPDNIVDSADAAWNAIYNKGSFPDVQNIAAFETAVLDALAKLRSETRATAELT